MINVKIIENQGLVALVTITGHADEFRADLDRLKVIPWTDRTFVGNAEPKYWRVTNAVVYRDRVVEIGDAIRLYKMQLRFPL